MRRIETTIAGIAIPDSALGREATEFVREASTPLLFHHSRRGSVGTILPDILEATVPGYVRPNACDAIQNSRFET